MTLKMLQSALLPRMLDFALIHLIGLDSALIKSMSILYCKLCLEQFLEVQVIV